MAQLKIEMQQDYDEVSLSFVLQLMKDSPFNSAYERLESMRPRWPERSRPMRQL